MSDALADSLADELLGLLDGQGAESPVCDTAGAPDDSELEPGPAQSSVSPSPVADRPVAAPALPPAPAKVPESIGRARRASSVLPSSLLGGLRRGASSTAWQAADTGSAVADGSAAGTGTPSVSLMSGGVAARGSSPAHGSAANGASSSSFRCPVSGLEVDHASVTEQQLRMMGSGRESLSVADTTRISADAMLDKTSHGKEVLVVGCLTSKSPVKTSSKGTKFLVWTLSDLRGSEVTTTLFDEAYSELMHEQPGQLIALVAPRVVKSDDSSRRAAGNGPMRSSGFMLSVGEAGQVVVVGRAVGCGQCAFQKRDGGRCRIPVDTTAQRFCHLHLQESYKKARSGRAQFKQASGNIMKGGLPAAQQGLRSASQGTYSLGRAAAAGKAMLSRALQQNRAKLGLPPPPAASDVPRATALASGGGGAAGSAGDAQPQRAAASRLEVPAVVELEPRAVGLAARRLLKESLARRGGLSAATAELSRTLDALAPSASEQDRRSLAAAVAIGRHNIALLRDKRAAGAAAGCTSGGSSPSQPAAAAPPGVRRSGSSVGLLGAIPGTAGSRSAPSSRFGIRGPGGLSVTAARSGRIAAAVAAAPSGSGGSGTVACAQDARSARRARLARGYTPTGMGALGGPSDSGSSSSSSSSSAPLAGRAARQSSASRVMQAGDAAAASRLASMGRLHANAAAVHVSRATGEDPRVVAGKLAQGRGAAAELTFVGGGRSGRGGRASSRGEDAFTVAEGGEVTLDDGRDCSSKRDGKRDGGRAGRVLGAMLRQSGATEVLAEQAEAGARGSAAAGAAKGKVLALRAEDEVLMEGARGKRARAGSAAPLPSGGQMQVVSSRASRGLQVASVAGGHRVLVKGREEYQAAVFQRAEARRRAADDAAAGDSAEQGSAVCRGLRVALRAKHERDQAEGASAAAPPRKRLRPGSSQPAEPVVDLSADAGKGSAGAGAVGLSKTLSPLFRAKSGTAPADEGGPLGDALWEALDPSRLNARAAAPEPAPVYAERPAPDPETVSMSLPPSRSGSGSGSLWEVDAARQEEDDGELMAAVMRAEAEEARARKAAQAARRAVEAARRAVSLERARGAAKERYLRRHLGDGGEDGARLREELRRKEAERALAETAPRDTTKAGASSLLNDLLGEVHTRPGFVRNRDALIPLPGTEQAAMARGAAHGLAEALRRRAARGTGTAGTSTGTSTPEGAKSGGDKRAAATDTPPTADSKGGAAPTLFGGGSLSSAEAARIFAARSRYAKSAEQEAMDHAMETVDRLAALEDVAEAAESFSSVKGTAYDCRQCGRQFSRVPDSCKEQGHSLRAVPITKHFRSCVGCGNRATGPRPANQTATACAKCGKRVWKAASVRSIRAPDKGLTARKMDALKPTGGPEVKSLRYG
ncbi:hypothetical protein FNF29_07365 [Cafeteria roenbergensis]|uniref:Uncharacterized protein n=2 Tax=Cafeteria roenbergensis TaxID=33653 RepID=A0A5A8C5T8_CAFRO|nr:hypothetical protein FNF29_07365 [Cafeteria roenbergensis]|eukprot:KAA0147420.1 hypothetical protein FNF29_07365 [Cafeteria roenbergensis]